MDDANNMAFFFLSKKNKKSLKDFFDKRWKTMF